MIFFKNKTEVKKQINYSFKANVKNISIYLILKISLVIFTIIRIFLFNIYLGIENFGLLNIMITISPFALFLIQAIQNKSMYIFFKPSSINNYDLINKLINEQIKNIRFFTIFSIFLVILLMIFAYFFVNSPGISRWTASMLILANSLGLLSFSIIPPIVLWYLNSIYKTYIFDLFFIISSTLLNVIVFAIVPLYGIHLFNFNDVSFQTGSVYIVLIVSCILGCSYLIANLCLYIIKKYFMPWYKKEKTKLVKIDNRTFGYIKQELLSLFTSYTITICFFIFTIFIPLSSSIAGIYYTYFTFGYMIQIVIWITSAIIPYIAKYFIYNTKKEIYELNNNIKLFSFFLCSLLFLNYFMISPYISIFTHGYFSFLMSLLVGINSFILCIKSIDENFIFLEGRPEKYFRLTLYELFIGFLSLLIGCLVIFIDKFFYTNVLNILYCVVICEIIERTSKYIFNIFYLTKNIYCINIKKYLVKKIFLYFIFILLIISCSLSIKFTTFMTTQESIFNSKFVLNYFENTNINVLFLDNYHLIKWEDLSIIVFFVNLFYILFIIVYLKFFKEDEIIFLKRIFCKILNK